MWIFYICSFGIDATFLHFNDSIMLCSVDIKLTRVICFYLHQYCNNLIAQHTVYFWVVPWRPSVIMAASADAVFMQQTRIYFSLYTKAIEEDDWHRTSTNILCCQYYRTCKLGSYGKILLNPYSVEISESDFFILTEENVLLFEN